MPVILPLLRPKSSAFAIATRSIAYLCHWCTPLKRFDAKLAKLGKPFFMRQNELTRGTSPYGRNAPADSGYLSAASASLELSAQRRIAVRPQIL